MNDEIMSMVGPGKVRVSRVGVALFNRRWPCSKLRETRAYWFEFDEGSGELIDSDVPHQDDGPEAAALADDCRAFYIDDTLPEWMPDVADDSDPAGDYLAYLDKRAQDEPHNAAFIGRIAGNVRKLETMK